MWQGNGSKRAGGALPYYTAQIMPLQHAGNIRHTKRTRCTKFEWADPPARKESPSPQAAATASPTSGDGGEDGEEGGGGGGDTKKTARRLNTRNAGRHIAQGQRDSRMTFPLKALWDDLKTATSLLGKSPSDDMSELLRNSAGQLFEFRVLLRDRIIDTRLFKVAGIRFSTNCLPTFIISCVSARPPLHPFTGSFPYNP